MGIIGGQSRINIKELEDLNKKLKRMVAGTSEQVCMPMVKRLTGELLRRVTQRTPIKDGTLIKNWNVSEVEKDGERYIVVIYNPMEYASYVEFGHRARDHQRWVEGRFMLEKSVEELQTVTPEFLERILEDYVRTCFDV